MKLRYLIIAIAILAGASATNAQTEPTANARPEAINDVQEDPTDDDQIKPADDAQTEDTEDDQTEATGNDIFVGGGVGIISPLTPGFNTPSVYINLQVGKYITPIWGVRASIGGPFMSLDAHEGNAYYADGTIRSFSNKLFGEINLEGMVNISNVFAKDLAKLNFYLFLGPTINFSSEGSKLKGLQYDDDVMIILVEESDVLKVRAGVTAGLGLSFNLTRSFALGLEGRFGVTPSIFGDGDQYRKAEGTTRITLNGVWTIKGANGKAARAAKIASKYGYISPKLARAMVDEALRNNPLIVEKIEEKPIEKIVEVEKIMYSEAPAPTAVFFEIDKTFISPRERVRLKLYAEAINACDSDIHFELAGYADRATGSVQRNWYLSEGRAKAVFDVLVSEGVDPARLEIKYYGGVEAMFYNNDVLSRTVIIKRK